MILQPKYELIKDSGKVELPKVKTLVVTSFIDNYQSRHNKLQPQDIHPTLTNWYGNNSVQAFYEQYVTAKFKQFQAGIINYWIQATIANELVGIATFQNETNDQNAVYMNLLAVAPDYNNLNLGKNLVFAITKLAQNRNIRTITSYIRNINTLGQKFYSNLGFKLNPDYNRDDIFVTKDLISAWSWHM